MAETQLMYTLPDPQFIKNIIFDFGGVLFDIDYQLPVAAFKKLGYSNFDQLYTQAAQSTLFDKMETGAISNDDFVSEIRTYLPESVSKQEILDAWNVILLEMPKSRIDMVYLLKEKFRTFLLSNTNAIHVDSFEAIIERDMGLAWFKGAFEAVHYSNEIGIKKPYPETFLKVCNWHGLIPQETLFIDDSLQHVLGAIEAGLHGYHLDLKKEDIEEALQIFVAS